MDYDREIEEEYDEEAARKAYELDRTLARIGAEAFGVEIDLDNDDLVSLMAEIVTNFVTDEHPVKIDRLVDAFS